MAELLKVENLRAGYGEAVVLQGVSLTLGEGDTLALLGRNGTGKTTFINTLAGATRQHGGSIWLGAGERRVALQQVKHLAYGKRRLLEIAIALACEPRVLLLDEPVAGVPAGEREELLQTVAALPADVSVLLIEHDMDLVFSFATRMTVLVNGTVLTEGDPDEIAADPRVKEVYLGEGTTHG